MPEWAEVKLMGKFADDVFHQKHVISIEKNPVNKQELKIGENMLLPATARVFHRGKENLIRFTHSFNGNLIHWEMRINYGMSGNWGLYNQRFGHKHSMLSFELNNGEFLEFVDPRRFGRWVVGTHVDWSKNRGPDPFEDIFLPNIFINLQSKDFKRPICEVMLDQRYFSGIGNYLRSEILHRLEINPFLPANQLSKKDYKNLLTITRSCLSLVYRLGGGKLLTWNDPNEADSAKTDFQSWLLCYKKGEWCIDGTKRRFWYDPKYKKDCPYK